MSRINIRLMSILFSATLVFVPVLFAFMVTTNSAYGDEILSVKKQKFAIDDAYVVADLNDRQDKLGLAKLNTGDKEFLKSWYAWNVTRAGTERILSIVYLKFDLGDVSNADDIGSASLKLYPFIANLTAASREITVYGTASGVEWSQDSIVYEGAPALDTKLNSTLLVTEEDVNKYLTWDITSMAKQNAGSNMTLALLIKSMNRGHEEQVVFYSQEHPTVLQRPTLIMEIAGSPSDDTPEVPEVTSDTGINYGVVGAIAAAVGAGGFGAGLAVSRMKKKSE
jgi:hypothetical protein